MNLTLPYPPSTNRLWAVYQGRARLTKEARQYKADVALVAALCLPQPFLGAVAVTIGVYRPRKAGDLDGRIKAVLDALQGVAFLNDSQVVELHAYRFDDKHNPRVEVRIEEAGG